MASLYADPASPAAHFASNAHWVERTILSEGHQAVLIGDFNIRPTNGLNDVSDDADASIQEWTSTNCFQEVSSRTLEHTWQRGERTAVLDRAFVGAGLANKGMIQWEL